MAVCRTDSALLLAVCRRPRPLPSATGCGGLNGVQNITTQLGPLGPAAFLAVVDRRFPSKVNVQVSLRIVVTQIDYTRDRP